MHKSMHSCDTCPYFDLDPGSDVIGECHRHAPQPLRLPEPGGDNPGWYSAEIGDWPQTMKGEFCGEHPANVAAAQLMIAMLIDSLTDENGHPIRPVIQPEAV